MKRVIYLGAILILLQSCTSLAVKPGISLDREIFNSKTWRVGVLDLQYSYEDEGQFGGTSYISAGENGGSVISGLLATELSRIENIQIVERQMIADIIAEQSFQLSGSVDMDTAIDIGRLTGADAVLVGELSDYVYWKNTGITGTTVSFSVRMISVETGDVILSGSISRARSLVDIFPNAQLSTKEFVDAVIALK